MRQVLMKNIYTIPIVIKEYSNLILISVININFLLREMFYRRLRINPHTHLPLVEEDLIFIPYNLKIQDTVLIIISIREL